MNFNKVLFLLTLKIMRQHKLTKTRLAKEMGLSLNAVSVRFKNLSDGKSIRTDIFVAIEEITNEKILPR